MLLPEGSVNFAVHEGDTRFCGLAEAKLPSVKQLTETIKGAGVSGEIDVAYLGHVAAMSMTLNFRALTKETVHLATPEQHQIELRAHQQSRNNETGQLAKTEVKHVVIGQATTYDPGKLAPAASVDASIAFTVTYFATYIDGERMVEVDPLNFIYYMYGTDYLADVRKSLGI